MGDRKDLHSPVRRAKLGVLTWIDTTMPVDAQMDAKMALDHLCEVAEREIEQAYFDGNKQHQGSVQARQFRPALAQS